MRRHELFADHPSYHPAAGHAHGVPHAGQLFDRHGQGLLKVTDKILEVRGLTKTYGGEKKPGAKQPTPTLDVLKGIDIDIYRGDVVCLIGPSGCGKSTFLRCLNRLEIPSSGSIKFEGTEVDEAHIDAVRQKMGMVFQHFNLFPHLTVKKNLELAPTLLKLKDKEAISAKADELLARVGLADKADAYPKSPVSYTHLDVYKRQPCQP